jgi:methyl-accepting chemotaxis protein
MDPRILPPLSVGMVLVSIVIMILIMRMLFKGSVLYKIGISTAVVIILASFISGVQVKMGPIHNAWAFPLQIIMAIIAYTYIARNVKRPLLDLLENLKKISAGDLDVSLDENILKKDDELGQISQALMQLAKGLNDKAGFASEIGNGNLDGTLEKLSREDKLGEALLHMQKSLQKASEEEKLRKEEDARRNWITEGLAKFADILRQNSGSEEEMGFNIVSNLVKYMKINQGGVFTLNDDTDDKYLELIACYAFDRRKYLEKRVEIGEGLLGTCFVEGKTTYMTHLPKDYVQITSGLGGENPSALLLVPLKINDEVYGVMELASFRKFEKHEVEFVEKIGEIVASAISGLKINNRTAILLEKSQQQAEEMRAQEEEMRQNMEELSATQEAMLEKERENHDRIRKMEKLNRKLASDIEDLEKQLKDKS